MRRRVPSSPRAVAAPATPGGALGGRLATAVLLSLALAPAPPAGAADIFVTSTEDGIVSDGNCTLREAIKAANLDVAVDGCASGEAAPVVDTILLTDPATPYRLTASGAGDELGDLDIFTSLEIVGAPALIDAEGLGDRVFDVRGPVEASFILVHVRGGDAGEFRGGGIQVRSGSAVNLFKSSLRGNRAAMGAAIAAASGAVVAIHDSEISHNGGRHAIDLHSATLELADSTVASNEGAGVTAMGSAATVSASLFSGNTSSGLRAGGASIVTLGNSTISGNGNSGEPGGGLRIETPAAASLYYATIAGNEASYGGGMHVTGALAMKGSILGANRSSGTHPDCYSESSQMTSQGSNLIHRAHCDLVPIATDVVGLDPLLDVLADWGGPTHSRRLLLGSPALDAGDAADFPPVDQRGEPRPRHGDLDAVSRPDAGAHENGNTIVVTGGTDPGVPNGDCSLRDALRSANTDSAIDGCRAGFGRDLIWIDPAVVGDVRLAVGGADEHAGVGDLDARGDVDVAGLPHRPAVVDGGGVDRVFDVHPPARLELSHLDVKNGVSFLSPGGGLRVRAGASAALVDVGFLSNAAVSQAGGALHVAGEVVGEDVWFHGNSADDSGGAIALDAADARLRLVRASITENESTQGHGGGVAVLGGLARLENATVAGNLAAVDGGGLYNQAILELRSATVAFNRANADGSGGGSGGGVHSAAGTARAVNSIVAGNFGQSSPDCGGTLLSGGYNLLGDASCSFVAATGDLVGVEAGLGAPVGGTYSLVPSSPARDAASPEMTGTLGTSCARRDGMGLARPSDGDGDGIARCDIGALEWVGAAILDVDADGHVLAASDGVLVLRHLFSFAGPPLTQGAVGAGAARSTPVEIAAYLAMIATLLDVDGNGVANALEDGLLVVRYLLGLTDGALTLGAIGQGATRTSAAEIAAYLDQLAGP